ncbi:MAG TPA: SDR family oxidoreductase [Nitrososphaeraceae archaeon]|nr:SDR family oxidoreductase [Nitrososphaeraceae archaeon]
MKGGEKVVIVTGTSSGIGFETAVLLARNGFITYATMRNPVKSTRLSDLANKEKLDIKIRKLDVNDETGINETIDQVISETGRIDVLVNNAGYAIFGALEDTALDEIREQFETNFFGPVRTIKAVIPIMKKQNGGKIINLSSMVGRFGVPFNSAYVASKFALEGITESTRYELHDYNIKIILVEPGIIKSHFFQNVKLSNKSTSGYSKLLKKRMEGIETMLKKATHPEIVAEVILDIINSRNTNIRYLVGHDAEFMLKLKKNATDEEFEDRLRKTFSSGKGYIN